MLPSLFDWLFQPSLSKFICALAIIVLGSMLENLLLRLMVWRARKHSLDESCSKRRRGRRMVTHAAWASQAFGSRGLRVALVRASYDAAREAAHHHDLSEEQISAWELKIVNWAFTHESTRAYLHSLVLSFTHPRH